jgi:glycosyltransferase involved in cell wall biosynthesis
MSVMYLLAITATNDRSEVEIYRNLVRKGHKVDLICHPDWSGEVPLIEGGVHVTKLNIRHRLDLRAVRELRRIIKHREPDVIYAPRNSALSTALMATRGDLCPVLGYRGTTGHLRRIDPASQITYFHRRLRGIVCVSEAVKHYLISQRIPEEMLHTIYKGHRLSWYNFGRDVDFGEFGIPSDAVVVGFTGNIRPVKGVDVLLRSLAYIPKELNVHVLLVGEVRDPRINKLAKEAEIAPRVHFAGYRSDAPIWAGACDIFVMPSVEREGLPRAVIEAMAQGVPAVVSAAGGMPELVEDGASGLVVAAREPEPLGRAIAKLAADPELRKEMGVAASERIATVFNVDRTIKKMEKLFLDTTLKYPTNYC